MVTMGGQLSCVYVFLPDFLSLNKEDETMTAEEERIMKCWPTGKDMVTGPASLDVPGKDM